MRESRNRFLNVGMALILTLMTCMVTSAQDVSANSMPGTDFSKYHTYKWVTIAGATQPNQIVDAQIKSSVDSQLATKGLTKTDSDKADLYIGYQVSLDQENQHKHYRRDSRVGYVRPVDQAARLVGACNEDDRSQQ